MFLGIYVHYDRMHCQCLQVVRLQFGQNFFFIFADIYYVPSFCGA